MPSIESASESQTPDRKANPESRTRNQNAMRGFGECQKSASAMS